VTPATLLQLLREGNHNPRVDGEHLLLSGVSRLTAEQVELVRAMKVELLLLLTDTDDPEYDAILAERLEELCFDPRWWERFGGECQAEEEARNRAAIGLKADKIRQIAKREEKNAKERKKRTTKET
jgi:hypothetical protein